MAKATKAISLGISALIVIVLILVVGFGVFLNSTFNTTQTTSANPGTINTSSNNSSSPATTATTAFYSESQQSLNSTSGLRLDLVVAPSNGSLGSIVININEYNTLDQVNNVTIENNWNYSEQYLNPFDGCGLTEPLGLAIFQGYYDLANYTRASALTLYNTSVAISCTTTVNVPTSYYSIRAQSDQAAVVYPSTNFVDLNTTLSLSFTTKGYWTGGIGSGSSAAFHVFPSGNYTVLAADEWGKVVLVHFVISGTGSTTASSQPQTTSTGYGCTSTTTTFVNVTVTRTATECVAPTQSSSVPNSNEMICVSTNYQVLGRASISVQNGTTYTSVTTITTSTQTTFTTTTTENQTVGYITSTTSYNPPSSWTVVSCTYVK